MERGETVDVESVGVRAGGEEDLSGVSVTEGEELGAGEARGGKVEGGSAEGIFGVDVGGVLGG